MSPFDPPPGIIWMDEARHITPRMTEIALAKAHEFESMPTERYFEPAPKAGPRGGDDRFRAAAKAGRRANRQRRRR